MIYMGSRNTREKEAHSTWLATKSYKGEHIDNKRDYADN